MSEPVRIAMWSGPRNISTAMMRAFGNRADCAVVDEPLYGFYLARTGLDHPGAEAVIASQPNDWREVAATLTGPVPGGAAVFYQKHMAHHLLAGVGRGWLARLSNCFLIRDPREVIASYVKAREQVSAADLGYEVQFAIFEAEKRRTGRTPPVLDAGDVLRDPAGMLSALCKAVGIAFDRAMLSWPAGRRESDGVWAPYWYANVERSTGFLPFTPSSRELPPDLEPLAAECRPWFEALFAERLRPVER
ncbi:hypothetical protein [Oceanibacterium hippocampi]|uniref:sulfotransferase-like domain-containing protein n=1 Tax=Oceanibacterium hippocampi TaxID=745714 RepID=UPI001C3934D3|nr:hypothetical protein [Oceanibacterium hippocampi]